MRYLFFLITFLSPALSNGQSGWEHIKSNNNLLAKSKFKESLKTDSTDLSAIKGMVYLSDVEGDDLSYNKYVDKLCQIEKGVNVKYIFSRDKINDSFENSVDQNSLEYKFNEAARYKYERNFKMYHQLLESNVTHLKWSLIGPFASVNGYGYVQEHEPEVGLFNPSFQCKNIYNQQLNWIKPEKTTPTGAILFKEHLPYSRSGGVYYANSFFELAEEETVHVKLTRKYPIKMWIDDQLVFEDREKINPNWDLESVSLSLGKGHHRILIKYVTGEVQDRFDKYRDTDWGESYSYGSSGSYSRGYRYTDREIKSARDGILIRLMSDKNECIKVESEYEITNYSKDSLSSKIHKQVVIDSCKRAIEQRPEDWFNYYLLIEAYNTYGVLHGLERQLVHAYNKHNNSVYFKYLLSKVYLYNGKREKSYEIMNHIDHSKTPVFKVLYKSLQEIDAENQPQVYLNRLMELIELTPSNIKIITKLLDYYDQKGLTSEKKQYAKRVKEEYPRYEYMMEKYLDDSHKPKDYDIGTKEESKRSKKWDKKYRDKKGKNTKKKMRSRFNRYDYEHLIKIKKKSDDVDGVLALYDALIAIEPYVMNHRKEKAKYLYNKDMSEKALKELQTTLKTKPYEADIYELVGDIYKDKKDDQTALKFYKKALAAKGDAQGAISGNWMNYGGGNLNTKIEQIEGQKQLKNKFTVPEFDEWLADTTWKEKYPDEESIVLGFTNEVLVDTSGQGYLWGKILIKILTDAGASSWTEHDFYQFGSIDYVKVIKPDGAEIYPERNGSFVIFKNLGAGDIIMVEGKASWSLSSERGTELTYFQRMMFQAPVNNAKFEVAVPKDSYLGYMHYKLEDNLEKRTDGEYDYYNWNYTNIPKVVSEEAILDETNTYAMIMVSTIKDWSPVVDWYKAQTYRKLESNYEIERILDEVIDTNMTDEMKVVAIYNWITKEINYSFSRLLQSGYIPKNTEHTCSSKIGDCKDVATLMISMLRHEGIDAYYVLVKTNNYFHQKVLPSIYFDHVITGVELNGKEFYFDLTTDFYPHYVINENDADAWALKIKEGVTEAFQLPNDYINPEKNLITHEMTCQLNLDKSMDIEVKSTHAGMAGGYIREVIHNKPRTDLKNEILDYMGRGVFGNLELLNFHYINRDDITAPLNSEYSFKAQEYSDDVLDIHFFKIPWMMAIDKSAAVLNDERHNTLYVGALTNTAPTKQKLEITFPESMKLKFIPKNVSIDNEFGVYQVTFKKVGKKLEIEKYQEFKTEQISIEKFPAFKEFYQKILKHDNMKVVLY